MISGRAEFSGGAAASHAAVSGFAGLAGLSPDIPAPSHGLGD